MNHTIDLNVDMGESFGLYTYGSDKEIIRSVSSANLACGFHGGDPTVMRNSVELAGAYEVAIGAHFGFRDLAGFGRRYLHMKPADLKNDITYQLGALGAFLHTAGLRLHHVKPHGALYMMALEDEEISAAIVEASLEFDSGLMIYTIADSATEAIATQKGMRVVREFFADRPYFADGRVKMFDWTLEEVAPDHTGIAQRVVRMVKEGVIPSMDGTDFDMKAETVCVHSDTPRSSEIAAAIRSAMEAEGIDIRPPD
jgi:UPF0271 protein